LDKEEKEVMKEGDKTFETLQLGAKKTQKESTKYHQNKQEREH
jgi:hypothetical protein